MIESTTPTLKTKGEIESIEPHRAEHARRRREQTNWFKNRALGAIRIMNDIVIDDRKIAIKTKRNFFEVKSFGQTMEMTLDKTKAMLVKDAMEHSFIEERINFKGDTHFVECKSRHITVWEYNPRTSQKWQIA
jgi:hypothetical protein